MFNLLSFSSMQPLLLLLLLLTAFTPLFAKIICAILLALKLILIIADRKTESETAGPAREQHLHLDLPAVNSFLLLTRTLQQQKQQLPSRREKFSLRPSARSPVCHRQCCALSRLPLHSLLLRSAAVLLLL